MVVVGVSRLMTWTWQWWLLGYHSWWPRHDHGGCWGITPDDRDMTMVVIVVSRPMIWCTSVTAYDLDVTSWSLRTVRMMSCWLCWSLGTRRLMTWGLDGRWCIPADTLVTVVVAGASRLMIWMCCGGRWWLGCTGRCKHHGWWLGCDVAAIRNITTDELDAVRLHLGRPLHAKYIMPDPTQFSVLSVYNASSLGLIEPASNRTPKGVCVLFEFDPMRVGIPLKQMWHYRFLLTYFPSFLSFFPIKREGGGGGGKRTTTKFTTIVSNR